MGVTFFVCVLVLSLLLHSAEHFLLQYDVRGKPKTTVYLLAELMKPDTEIKLSDEHQDFKWVSLDKACELVEHQTLQEVLKECSAFVQQNHT